MAATFLDLLRAKVAVQLKLLDAAGARAGLTATDGGIDASDLLDWLRQMGTSPDDVARVDKYARRCMFLKGESFYLRFLRARQLIPEGQLQPILWQVRQAPDGKGLGQTLLDAGLVDAATHAQLSSQTQQTLQADNETTTGRYRERSFDGIERSSHTVVQVITEDQQRVGVGVVPAPGEGTQILPQSVAAGITPLAVGAPGPAIPIGSAPVPVPLAVGPQPPAGPVALPPELAGTGLDEGYDVIRKLGEGGMGVVYLAFAKDDDDRKPMALKVVHRSAAGSKDAAERFKREILATSFCAHENIIEIYDASETQDGSYYMAMEYLEGEELADILKDEGPLPIPRFMRLLEQALEGLQAVHSANIVHRDIKPQNFRIVRLPDGREKLKIVDFGIARVLDAEDSGAGDQFFRTMGGKITGSPAYIAPESITEPVVDGRADLYSLGITIFRVLTGRLPFQAKQASEYLPMHLYNRPPPLRSVLADAPAELEELVSKLLEKMPAKRFQTAQEALEFLRAKVLPAVGVGAPGAAQADVVSDAPGESTVPMDAETTAPMAALEAGAAAAAPQDGLDQLDLGFTQENLSVPTLQPPSEPDAGEAAAPAGEAVAVEKKPGFFARMWAALFGKKKKPEPPAADPRDAPTEAEHQPQDAG